MPRLLLLWLALTGSALANDRLPVTQVRFSASGERVLAVTQGARDGSGFGTAQVTVLSTTSSRVTFQAQRTADQAPGHVLTDLLAAPATRAALSGLAGRPLSRPRYQRVYSVSFPRWSDATPPGQTQVTPVALWSRAVPVRLHVVPLPSDCSPELLPPGERPAGFILSVNGQEVWRDRALPSGRACAARYTLERVDVQGNRVLVTVRAYGPGFEGPDATALFVAVTLK
ncbi:DUF2259 domain-containing protein [Deinococcus taeanensis]|uniref:DUF2259 domain-containing protein n=1 Tax=Deinococcus taeanensis TaxID=2737050 RepID=UPI001CDD5A12|nr:DUF2259 domain-containing protein [Deinococcus taeanensis]UBV43687.1 DUF2259 domain-containing protein [Deinococcus taeanensis]